MKALTRRPLSQITHQESMNRKRANSNCDDYPKRKVKKNSKNQRAGTIMHMVLKNFMCHTYLDVDFESNINYIIGRNGSGKSAILTALVVGLGAKASVTSRGTSIKGFIKAGQASCSVEITLSNEGSMAYKPHIYGNSIIIQRHINASGGSTYKIRSSEGKVIATTPREIQNITSKLSIQIDNPVCILNQDTSRNFLSSSDPKAKYILFNRATRLETLYEEYKQFSHNKKDATQIYKGKQEILDKLTQEIAELEKKIDDQKNIQNVINDLQHLQEELLWSKVKDSEDEYNKLKEIVDNLTASHQDLQGNTLNRQQRIQEIVETVSSYNQQLKEIRDEADLHKDKKNQLIKKIDALKLKFGKKKIERSALNRDLSNKQKDKSTLENEIASFTQRLSEMEQKKLDTLRKTADYEDKFNKLQAMIDSFQNEIFQHHGDIKKKEEDLNNAQRELNDANTQCNINEQNLRALRNEKDHKLAAYGRDMNNVVQAVNAAKNKFSELPRGPLGSYISVKDKKWSVAIEGYLGKASMHSFFVNNGKDAALLSQIMQQHWRSGPKPTIITSKFIHKVHDVSSNLVRRSNGCISIFEAISVSDPVVMNRLIDDSAIEGILLIPGDDQAVDMMSNAQNVPRNCRQAVSLRGDKYYPDPGYKMYGSRYHEARYLQVDTAEVIRQMEDSLKRYMADRNAAKEKYGELKGEINKRNDIVAALNVKVSKSRAGAQIARKKLAELQSAEETDSGNVHQLEMELTEITNRIATTESKIENMNTEISEIQEEVTVEEVQLTKLKEADLALQERTLPIEDMIRDQFLKRQQLSTNDEFDKRRIMESKRKLDSVKLNLANITSKVQEETEQATRVGPRTETLRKVPALVQLITSTQRKINVMQSNTEDPLALHEKHVEKSERCNKTKEILELISSDLFELNQAYESRKRLCRNTRDYFENFVNHCFSNYLKARQFKGGLSINFDEKTLDLVVVPQQGSQGVTATSNLSGGERSFSTVGFLYSLWQCLDFPFYFLDEFDVFMDKFNRTAVMEILIQHAKSRPDVQFIFLTPQDVSFINDSDVAIHRLEDPARRALTQQ